MQNHSKEADFSMPPNASLECSRLFPTQAPAKGSIFYSSSSSCYFSITTFFALLTKVCECVNGEFAQIAGLLFLPVLQNLLYHISPHQINYLLSICHHYFR